MTRTSSAAIARRSGHNLLGLAAEIAQDRRSPRTFASARRAS
jgi:hypothetical protein